MQTNPNTVSRRRTAYSVLIGIILLTIPCYLIGLGALFILRRPDGAPALATPTAAATQTVPPTATLAELPTQFVPPTVAPPIATAVMTAAPTATVAPLPTPSSTFTPTLAPTLIADTATPIPAVTIIFVDTPTPTATATPTLIPTLVIVETPTPAP